MPLIHHKHQIDCPAHAAACVIVLNELGHVLVVWNERHKCFGLPGGKREPEDEEIVYTAQRELREETGVVVNALYFTWLYCGRYAMLPESDPAPRDVHLYVARAAITDRMRPAEGHAIAWMPWGCLLTAAPAFRSFYEDALPNGIDHLKPTTRVR